jgi:hypothetical protein
MTARREFGDGPALPVDDRGSNGNRSVAAVVDRLGPPLAQHDPIDGTTSETR